MGEESLGRTPPVSRSVLSKGFGATGEGGCGTGVSGVLHILLLLLPAELAILLFKLFSPLWLFCRNKIGEFVEKFLGAAMPADIVEPPGWSELIVSTPPLATPSTACCCLVPSKKCGSEYNKLRVSFDM